MVRCCEVLAYSLLCLLFVGISPQVGFGRSAEYRALWIDAWNEGIFDAESTRLTVARARQHNFNTLFVEVSKVMDAYYRSDFLPRGNNIAEGYDPLGGVLRYAKPKNPRIRSLEVHAWVVALRAWKDKPLPPKNLKPAHVMREHADWISKNYRGARFDGSNYFLDPGHPGVQEFVVRIAREIVEKYPVDGLHLDYIRYPGNEWGYNPTSLKRFQKEMKRKDIPKPDDPQWSAWRREQINNLVRRIAVEIRNIRPGIKLSAATITWGDLPDGDFKKSRAYNDALQNWAGWMEAGYLDINVPMIYKRASDPLQARDFVDWTRFASSTKNGRHVITGLGAWFNPLSATIRQIKTARKLNSDGVSLFSYNQMESRNRQSPYVMRDLSGRIFKSPVSVPRASWIESPRSGTLAGADPKHRSGYPVFLLDKKGEKRARVRTDANGYFAFFGLRPGTWRVQVGTASILSRPVRVQRGRVARVRF